jgi:hypothetical protein
MALLANGGFSADVPAVSGVAYTDVLQLADDAHHRGWINGTINHRADGEPFHAQDLAITAAGREAAQVMRRTAPADTASRSAVLDRSVDAKRARRAEFMDRLYTHTHGSEQFRTTVQDVSAELGWPEFEAEEVANYLEAEGLLRFWTEEGVIGLTHAGIREYEQLVSDPARATEHFPPAQTVNLHIAGSTAVQVAVAGGDVAQTSSTGDIAVPAVNAVIATYRAALESDPLPDADAAEAIRALEAIENELARPQPRTPLVRSFLSTLNALAIGVAGNAAWAGVVAGLTELLR